MSQPTVNPCLASTRSCSRADRIVATRSATGLKPAEKLLLRSLVDFMGNRLTCWPSLATLSREVGLSVRHVRRMLRVLEAAGWIETEYRFRPDRSQTSCVFAWVAPPDMQVRPPRTCRSALELSIGKFKTNTYAGVAECVLSSEPNAPAELVPPAAIPLVAERPLVPDRVAILQLEAAAVIPPIGEKVSLIPLPPKTLATPFPEKVQIAPLPPKTLAKPSPRFIVIDRAKFLDLNEAHRVYNAAVAAKLLNAGGVDRIAFFACWCAIAAKLKADQVKYPERMMRFLLDNRKAMSAYPDHAAEQKAREAIRKLWPERAYNPHL